MWEIFCYNIERLAPKKCWMTSMEVYNISKALTLCLELCNGLRDCCAIALDDWEIPWWFHTDKVLRKGPWIVEKII